MNDFTKQEKQVVLHLVSGHSNKNISLELQITENTVKFHLRNIYRKLKVHSRSQLIFVLSQKKPLFLKEIYKTTQTGR